MHNTEISSTMANLVQVVSMCNAWHTAGYDVTLMLRSKNMDENTATSYLGSRLGMNCNIKIKLITSSLPERISRHLSPFSIRKIISKTNPDFCFVRDPVYFNMSVRAGKPTILELHNTRLHIGIEWINRIYHRMVIRGSNSKLCPGVISISEALATYWEKCGVSHDKLKVLHDGFSPELFRQILSKSEARSQFSLPDNRKIVVYTGNLQANRGIDYILDLAGMNSELLFVVAGGTPARIDHYSYFSKSRNLSNILFLGHIPHVKVPALLYAADVLLAMWSKNVPTIGYCSPLKVFEYMATGIPAVYPAYPTIREVIDGGINGFLAVPDDLESMNVTLHRALSLTDEQKEIFLKNSRSRAFNQFTWTARVKEIITLLPENLKVL